jgi:hypothetical protein
MDARTAELDSRPLDDTAGRHGLRGILGAEAWQRLPAAVRARFAEGAPDACYAGAFEVVAASALGRCFAWLGTLVGTPVVPRTGANVAARVDVRATANGVEWRREYRWGNHVDVVTSTKMVRDGVVVERLPGRLNMPLEVREEGGVLVFESRGYYFDLRLGDLVDVHLPLPVFFSPGRTRVEHVDGQMFFQTGRFCATE